jgi:hypothetical protein
MSPGRAVLASAGEASLYDPAGAVSLGRGFQWPLPRVPLIRLPLWCAGCGRRPPAPAIRHLMLVTSMTARALAAPSGDTFQIETGRQTVDHLTENR